LGWPRFEGAELQGAKLEDVSFLTSTSFGPKNRHFLDGATFDRNTTWPQNFNPEARGARRLEEHDQAASIPPTA
jgi:hypothetical protein